MNIITPKEIFLDSSNVDENNYAEWLTGTAYIATEIVYVTLSEDTLTEIKPHKKYQSLTGNTGSYPPNNLTDWLDLGATNRWALFDNYVSSQTSNANTIDIALSASKVDRLCFFGLQAASIQIVVKDSVESVITDETITMGGNTTTSWSEYFFNESYFRDSYIHTLQSLYVNTTIEITITGLDSVAKCGQLILGKATFLGLTEYGVSASIDDYSRKETNDFGETFLSQRAFAKTLDIDLWIDHTPQAIQYDKVYQTLSNIRATPVVFDANNKNSDRQTFQIFGYYKDFSLIADFAIKSQCTLTIEGLI